jgi:hypothetical protein
VFRFFKLKSRKKVVPETAEFYAYAESSLLFCKQTSIPYQRKFNSKVKQESSLNCDFLIKIKEKDFP